MSDDIFPPSRINTRKSVWKRAFVLLETCEAVLVDLFLTVSEHIDVSLRSFRVFLPHTINLWKHREMFLRERVLTRELPFIHIYTDQLSARFMQHLPCQYVAKHISWYDMTSVEFVQLPVVIDFFVVVIIKSFFLSTASLISVHLCPKT